MKSQMGANVEMNESIGYAPHPSINSVMDRSEHRAVGYAPSSGSWFSNFKFLSLIESTLPESVRVGVTKHFADGHLKYLSTVDGQNLIFGKTTEW